MPRKREFGASAVVVIDDVDLDADHHGPSESVPHQDWCAQQILGMRPSLCLSAARPRWWTSVGLDETGDLWVDVALTPPDAGQQRFGETARRGIRYRSGTSARATFGLRLRIVAT